MTFTDWHCTVFCVRKYLPQKSESAHIQVSKNYFFSPPFTNSTLYYRREKLYFKVYFLPIKNKIKQNSNGFKEEKHTSFHPISSEISVKFLANYKLQIKTQ